MNQQRPHDEALLRIVVVRPRAAEPPDDAAEAPEELAVIRRDPRQVPGPRHPRRPSGPGAGRVGAGEAWLVGAHVAPFEGGNRYNHEPKRIRKLLLHRSEIDELLGRTKAKGQTIVPLRLYLTRGKAKVELGLARGKKAPDKRDAIRERTDRREVDRAMATARKRGG